MRLRLTLALTFVALLAVVPSAQAQGCMNSLPVSHSFKSTYAASYKANKMPVRITSSGSWIHHIKAEVYTFGGDLVAKSRMYEGGFNTSKTLSMKLLFGAMQIGKYTLVVTGEPNTNRSCGPKRYTKVVEFSSCPKGLPISFPNAPEGKAGNYGRWLSVYLAPQGAVLREIRVELYDFKSNFFGRAKLKALFGVAKVDIKLRHKLVNGSYNLLVTANRGAPRGCGHKRAKKVLTFGKKKTGSGGGGDGGDDGGDDGFGGGGGGDTDSGATDGDGFGGGTQDGDGTEA